MKRSLLFHMLLLLTLTASLPSLAQRCEWLGGTGNFSDPANWSCGHIPLNSDSIFILSGTCYYDTTIYPRLNKRNPYMRVENCTFVIRPYQKVFSLYATNAHVIGEAPLVGLYDNSVFVGGTMDIQGDLLLKDTVSTFHINPARKDGLFTDSAHINIAGKLSLYDAGLYLQRRDTVRARRLRLEGYDGSAFGDFLQINNTPSLFECDTTDLVTLDCRLINYARNGFKTRVMYFKEGWVEGHDMTLNLGELYWKNGNFDLRNQTDSIIVNNKFVWNHVYNDVTWNSAWWNGKLILKGNNEFQRGEMSVFGAAQILTTYGSVTTVGTHGNVILHGLSGGDYLFSNYGSLTKVNDSATAAPTIFDLQNFRLRNGRDFIIKYGTVKTNKLFQNLNLVRGYGTLDVSQAPLMENTGTFTGGVTLIGTLKVNGNYKNNELLVDLKGDNPATAQTHDSLYVSGNADITNTKIRLRERGLVADGSSYVVLKCNGGLNCLTGTFGTVDAPAGYSVSYTGNSVIVAKSGARTTLRAGTSGTLATEQSVNRLFKIFKTSGNTYRIESSKEQAEVLLMDMQGKLIRKVKLNSYFVNTDLAGISKGVYVAKNITTGEQMKFLVY